jgi:flagellar hook-basal body complex protein FliE
MPAIPAIGAAGLTPASALSQLNPIDTNVAAGGAASSAQGASQFASLLANQLDGVQDLQSQANAASQAVATGQTSDLSGATVAVEKASIALELVGAVRNKAIEAYQDVMRMQV